MSLLRCPVLGQPPSAAHTVCKPANHMRPSDPVLFQRLPCRQEGAVLVCTDAAARGLDIPDVSHVVQADFAGSAIDFLHRVRCSTGM